MKHMCWLVVFAACGGTSEEGTPDAAEPDATVIAPLPDLRFKWVGAFPSYLADVSTSVSSGLTFTDTGPFGFSPVGVDSGFVTSFAPTVPVAARKSIATLTPAANVATAIGATPQGSVINSLALVRDSFAMVIDQAVDADPLAPTAQALLGAVATEPDIAAYVADQAANHRVVTALAFDGAQIDLLAYVRDSDPASYETSVLGATVDTIPAQAAALATGGYIITAFGRSSTTGYTLVGTRVAGETSPHDAMVVSPANGGFAQGYALVGRYFVDVADDFDRQIFER